MEQKSDTGRGGKCHVVILTRGVKIFRHFARLNLLYFSSKLNTQIDEEFVI